MQLVLALVVPVVLLVGFTALLATGRLSISRNAAWLLERQGSIWMAGIVPLLLWLLCGVKPSRRSTFKSLTHPQGGSGMGGLSFGSLDQRLLERLRTTLGVSRSVLASVSDTVLSSPAASPCPGSSSGSCASITPSTMAASS